MYSNNNSFSNDVYCIVIIIALVIVHSTKGIERNVLRRASGCGVSVTTGTAEHRESSSK